ncbi:Pfmc-2TM Maurer's cleft two transmembrane, putative [Plasmodium sp.]|nr:Pfmc-2TM Maurer's cleft two transmembrane, putative [Plasmodium sp.]
MFLKVKNAKDNKTKNFDPQISNLVNLVDNMNITQRKKDKIKILALKYKNSDDIKEKNKSINELKKYSKNDECKEHMHNYLMYLRIQNDIKYLKRNNLWNNIWIIVITLLLIILLLSFMPFVLNNRLSIFLFTYILSKFMIYIFARFFPKIKIAFKVLKENYTNYFKKKSE